MYGGAGPSKRKVGPGGSEEEENNEERRGRTNRIRRGSRFVRIDVVDCGVSSEPSS